MEGAIFSLTGIMASECRGCLLVRQSFFHDDSRNFTDVGGGVTGCRGFHSSFRPTHGGLSLNMGKYHSIPLLSSGPLELLCTHC